jgi:hypothetical protein
LLYLLCYARTGIGVILVAVLVSAFLSAEAQTSPDQSSPLQGKVRTDHLRVQRPATPIKATTNSTKLQGQVDEKAFTKLHQSAATSEEISPQLESEISIPEPLHSSAPAEQLHPAITSGITRPQDNTGGGGTVPDAVTIRPAIGASLGKKEITIRLKRFRSLNEMDIDYEAIKMASLMQSRGGQVTVLLDLEAVHAADRHDTMFAEFQLHRGQGTHTEKDETVQAVMSQFIQDGGAVLVSDRWAKYYGMADAHSLVNGAKLVTDEEIADHLLNSGNILDY